MQTTPLSFLNQVERMLQDALPPPPAPATGWAYQRFLNLSDQAGSLQILLQLGGANTQLTGIVHARICGGTNEPFIQGWIQLETLENRNPFVFRQLAAARLEEDIAGLIRDWAEWLNRSAIELTSSSKSGRVAAVVPTPPPVADSAAP